jgi:hypothetical protein
LGQTVPQASLGGRKRWRPRGRHLAGRLAAAGEESVVDVPSKLSQHECGCSQPVTLARTISWICPRHRALAAWRNERLAERSIPRPGRKCCASFPRGAKTWWPSVLGRSIASTGSYGTSCPAGYPERSRPTEPRASCAALDRKAPRPASVVDWLRRSCA